MENGDYQVMKVLDRKTKKAIWIKEVRFNSLYHMRIKGENPQPKDTLEGARNIAGREQIIVLDKMQAAVEKGRKAQEEDVAEEADEKSESPEDTEEVYDPETGDIENAFDENKADETNEDLTDGSENSGEDSFSEDSDVEKMQMNELRNMAKELGLKFDRSTTKKEFIELLKKR